MLSIWKENHSNTAILFTKKNSKDCPNGNTQCISQDTRLCTISHTTNPISQLEVYSICKMHTKINLGGS